MSNEISWQKHICHSLPDIFWDVLRFSMNYCDLTHNLLLIDEIESTWTLNPLTSYIPYNEDFLKVECNVTHMLLKITSKLIKYMKNSMSLSHCCWHWVNHKTKEMIWHTFNWSCCVTQSSITSYETGMHKEVSHTSCPLDWFIKYLTLYYISLHSHPVPHFKKVSSDVVILHDKRNYPSVNLLLAQPFPYP